MRRKKLCWIKTSWRKGLKFFSIGAFVPSDDGNILAYSTDTTGYRQYKLQFKDLRTNQLLPDILRARWQRGLGHRQQDYFLHY